MSESRIYEFQIDGKVSTQRLLRALEGWSSAVYQIGQEIGISLGNKNEVSGLSGGSALAAFEVSFPDSHSAERFSASFDYVIRAAKFQEPIDDHTSQYRKAVKKFRSAAKPDIEGSVSGMVWRSPSGDFIINPEIDAATSTIAVRADEQAGIETVGVVEGTLQSLSARNGVRAVVYDTIFDRAVAFTIPEKMREEISDKWDKPVEVVGVVRRDPVSGRPLSIVEVMAIDLLQAPENSNAWLDAIGILSDIEPGVLPEVLIRRLRDD